MKITLDDAIPLVRIIEQKLIPMGAHCALGGSVLHRGESNKDLDIFVYPHSKKRPRTPDDLIEILKLIFPDNSQVVTDENYPHDRIRFTVIHEIAPGSTSIENYWKIELFVFLTQPPILCAS